MFEVFDHTADLGLRVTAEDLNQLFADAASGLFSVVVANPEAIAPREQHKFTISGDELEYLFFDWLNELLYTYETKHLLFAKFDVRVDQQGLRAKALGEPVDPDRHHLEHEVKAITYHGLKVEQTDRGWQAEVIVDI